MRWFVFAIMLSSCSSVLRDADTYKTEVAWWLQATKTSANALRPFVSEHCRCVDGSFTTSACEEAAGTLAVLDARASWHAQMMLFEAKLTETDPGSAPKIANLLAYCPEVTP